MTKLRIVFMGTPDFSVPCLAALTLTDHAICAVYCQPPRPAGRGHKPRLSPVQAFAEMQGLAVRHPVSLKDPEAQAEFATLQADIAVVVAYGLILPAAILEAPRHGCLNVHASLLPRWRGAAPIQRAILAGDRQTGITIMQMDEGLDTGNILLQQAIDIGGEETAGGLHDRLSALGADLIVEAVDAIASGKPPLAHAQDGALACYAAKIDKAEGQLDWRLPAEELARRVRAFDPWPGVWFDCQGERVKVRRAEAVPGKGEPGVLLDDRLTVACGEGALRLVEVQRAGKAAMAAEDFLRGFTLLPGVRLS